MKKRTRKLLLLGALLGGRVNAAEVSVTVAQAGADAGIRNRVFTTWLPAGEGFAGLSGRIALAGNAPGFSEALVLLGTTRDDRETCARGNHHAVETIPGLARLWAGILKSNDANPVSVPVAFTLPNAVPPSTREGTCLVTVVSAGYPILRRDRALYTRTSVELAVATSRVAAGPILTFGMGGEFRFAPGTANYVGIQALRPLAVDAIAASISAGPGPGMQARGTWRVTTNFLYLTAPACNASNLATHAGGHDYSVVRLPHPAPIRRPSGAADVLDIPVVGQTTQTAQAVAFARIIAPLPTRLHAGDCLLAFTSVPDDAAADDLDVENQSTVYLRPLTPFP